MKIVWNLVIWLILPLPATAWLFNTMKMNNRSASSWADRVAVCIIAAIFVSMCVLDLLVFIGICGGVNVFGVP